MKGTLKLSAQRVSLAFTSLVSGMSRKLPRINEQLIRTIGDDEDSESKVYLGSYKRYMNYLKGCDLGTYDICLPGGCGRKVDILETIKMTFKHEVHFHTIINERISTRMYAAAANCPDDLHIRVSADGANVTHEKSVVTMTMSMLCFGALIHAPLYNMPIAHFMGNESKAMLREKLSVCYDEIHNLNGKVVQLHLFSGGVFFARLKFHHVYDLKFAYNGLGHRGWSSEAYPHLFCLCPSLKLVSDNPTSSPEKECPPQIKCVRMTAQHFKNLVIAAKTEREHIESEFGYLTHKEKEKMFQDFVIEENFGVTDTGALAEFIDMDTMRPDPLHCYLGNTTQHLKYIQQLKNELGIEDTVFYANYKQAVKGWPSTVWEKIMCQRIAPTLIGRYCNVFWEAVKCNGGQQFLEMLFGAEHNEATNVVNFGIVLNSFQCATQLMQALWINRDGIKIFKAQVCIWFEHATLTIFAAKKKETVYAHILRNIIPSAMESWYNETGVGYGFFSMQGPKHVNKQTKNLLQRHTNHHFDRYCIDGSANDSFVSILRIVRWKFFAQHLKEHSTDLKKEIKVKMELFLNSQDEAQRI